MEKSPLQEIKATIEQLGQRKEAIMAESDAIIAELLAAPTTGGDPMGVDTPLTDAEGYPRNDIDVLRARSLRNRFAILKTNHATVMQQLDSHLCTVAQLTQQQQKNGEQAELLARQQPKPKPKFDPVSGKWVVRNWDGTVAGDGAACTTTTTTNKTSTTTTPRSFDTIPATTTTTRNDNETTTTCTTVPWAIIQSVAPESPAATAGLLPGDRILSWGPLQTWTTTTTTTTDNTPLLRVVVEQAAASQTSLVVRVQRPPPPRHGEDGGTTTVSLTLSPRPWAGRGLLGCHMVPYTS